MQPILETLNLSKNFGSLQAVNNVNLKIREGSIHSIIGPNGAGKTTLFNLLTGFHTPSSGRAYFKGKEITRFSPHKISRMKIGRSFQITSIFPELSVKENIRIAAQSRTKVGYHLLKSLNGLGHLEEKAQRMLKRIGLADKSELLAKHLSHGEKRILDIGIGLATDPQLLLLDEPTSGLSGDEISRITDVIRDISAEVTILLIEHNIDVVISISNTITVLHQGQVIAEGSPDDIQRNQRVQEAYLGDY
jgi:branched-chain amino acid transport system ATP-binding protein